MGSGDASGRRCLVIWSGAVDLSKLLSWLTLYHATRPSHADRRGVQVQQRVLLRDTVILVTHLQRLRDNRTRQPAISDLRVCLP
ncbi:hypothetical protein MTP99_015127 [Tenebrio molitor]|nr:hypothetical protein MTP99_015127 [Tenebrio molitor]